MNPIILIVILSILTTISSQLTFITDDSLLSKGGDIKITIGNNVQTLSKVDVGCCDRYIRPQTSEDINWETDDITIEGVSFEAVRFSEFGPMSLLPFDSDKTTPSTTITVDSTPYTKWSIKPWGRSAFIATSYSLKIDVSDCCGSAIIKIRYFHSVCGTLFGLSFNCHTKVSDYQSKTANKGSSVKFNVGTYGAFELIAGTTTYLTGVEITNTNQGNFGINRLTIEDYVNLDSCYLKTNSNSYFKLPIGESIFFPCMAPSLSIPFTIPLPPFGFTGILSNIFMYTISAGISSAWLSTTLRSSDLTCPYRDMPISVKNQKMIVGFDCPHNDVSNFILSDHTLITNLTNNQNKYMVYRSDTKTLWIKTSCSSFVVNPNSIIFSPVNMVLNHNNLKLISSQVGIDCPNQDIRKFSNSLTWTEDRPFRMINQVPSTVIIRKEGKNIYDKCKCYDMEPQTDAYLLTSV